MDTQEILPENIEESHLPNSGLDEIEAAMEKISELEQADSDASEQALEDNPETKRTNLKDSDAKSKTTTEEAEAQEEKTEPTSTGEEQSTKSNKLWHEKKLKFKAIAERDAIAAERDEYKKMLKEALDRPSSHKPSKFPTKCLLSGL